MNSANRSTRQVLESHLRHRQDGDLDGDLAANYASDVVLLSAEGINHGVQGVCHLAGILRSYVEPGTYVYDELLVDDRVGMLQWHANDGSTSIHDGADTFLVENGVIRVQTIRYSTEASSS